MTAKARSSRSEAHSNCPLLAGSAISRMPPKAVAGWFVAGTDGQLWGVITIAYFRPGADIVCA